MVAPLPCTAYFGKLAKYPTVPSPTRADTVVANATTKKVNEKDTKTFPKCYVGRNGKRNQQKLQLQGKCNVVGMAEQISKKHRYQVIMSSKCYRLGCLD